MALHVEDDPGMAPQQEPMQDTPRWPGQLRLVSAETGAPLWPIEESAEEVELQRQPNSIQRVIRGVGNAALMGLVAFELSPLNEVSRLAAAGAVGAVTRSPELAAATFAASTVVVESVGAVATACLLQTEAAQKLTQRTNDLLAKVKLDRMLETNPAIDMGVSLVAGVPAALVIKHRQDPERNLGDDLRYGMALTLGSAAVIGGESFAVARGIVKAGSLPVLGGVIVAAGGAYLGIKSWVGNRLERRMPFGYEGYEEALQDDGPQLRGYQKPDYDAILRDPTTKSLQVRIGKQSGLWPVLADIHHNSEYVPAYFDFHYGEDNPTFYLSLPPRDALRSQKLQRQLADHIYETLNAGGTIVFDQLMDHEDTLNYVHELTLKYHPDLGADHLIVDPFIDPTNNSPAEAAHFEGLAAAIDDKGEQIDPNTPVVDMMRARYHELVESGMIDSKLPNRTIIVDPDTLDLPLSDVGNMTVIERMWAVYQQRFEILLENNPVRGKQSYDEFAALVRDPSTLVVAQITDGNITAFTYIADVKHCEWLNPKHFADKYPNEPSVYFPGIVADRQAEGRSSLRLIKLMGDLMTQTVGRVRIVWQCTNVSKEYVPRIVQIGIEHSGSMKLAEPIKESNSYRYFGVSLKSRQHKEG